MNGIRSENSDKMNVEATRLEHTVFSGTNRYVNKV
jgi:hypothetical protein